MSKSNANQNVEHLLNAAKSLRSLAFGDAKVLIGVQSIARHLEMVASNVKSAGPAEDLIDLAEERRRDTEK